MFHNNSYVKYLKINRINRKTVTEYSCTCSVRVLQNIKGTHNCPFFFILLVIHLLLLLLTYYYYYYYSYLCFEQKKEKKRRKKKKKKLCLSFQNKMMNYQSSEEGIPSIEVRQRKFTISKEGWFKRSRKIKTLKINKFTLAPYFPSYT